MASQVIDSEFPEVEADDERELRSLPQVMPPSALRAIVASEIDVQIATAKEYPRNVADFRKRSYQLIVQDQVTAAAMIYALPRGKEQNPSTGRWEQKIVKGPTARFAELIGNEWGNCRYGARLVSEDTDTVTAMGWFHDLEKNVAVSYEVRRRITDKDGRRYNPDMVAMTANAACSVALRNAVLKGIPQALWRLLYESAEKTLMGKTETLSDRRQKLLDQFKPFGITAPMACRLVGAQGQSEIGMDQMVTLNGILTALRDGDVSPEQLLAEAAGQDKAVAEKGKRTTEAIKQKYRASEVSAEAEAAQKKLEQKRQSAKGDRAPLTEAAPASPRENLDADEPPEKLGVPMKADSW